MQPILSRFCHIYIENVFLKKKYINLHEYNINLNLDFNKIYKNRDLFLKKKLDGIKDECLVTISEYLYNKGYCALDLLEYIKSKKTKTLKDMSFVYNFNNIKYEIRDECLLMYIILFFISYNCDLKNILLH